VKLLLDHGNVTYDDTIKALVVAVAFGRLETSGVLLDYGLNIGIREAWESGFGAWTILMIAYEGNDDIRSPSLQAARNDWLKLVRFLLERGADVNATLEDKMSPLRVTIRYKQFDVLPILLEYGVKIDIRAMLWFLRHAKEFQ